MSGKLQGQILEILLVVVILCCILIGSNHGLLLSLYNVVKNLLIIAATIGIAPVIVNRLPDKMTAKEGIAYIIALFVAVIVASTPLLSPPGSTLSSPQTCRSSGSGTLSPDLSVRMPAARFPDAADPYRQYDSSSAGQ